MTAVLSFLIANSAHSLRVREAPGHDSQLRAVARCLCNFGLNFGLGKILAQAYAPRSSRGLGLRCAHLLHVPRRQEPGSFLNLVDFTCALNATSCPVPRTLLGVLSFHLPTRHACARRIGWLLLLPFQGHSRLTSCGPATPLDSKAASSCGPSVAIAHDRNGGDDQKDDQADTRCSARTSGSLLGGTRCFDVPARPAFAGSCLVEIDLAHAGSAVAGKTAQILRWALGS